MNMYPESMNAQSLPIYCVFEWVTIYYYLSIACDPVTALLSCWCVCDLSEICGGLGENFFMKQYDMPHFFSQFVWSPSPVLILECQPSKVWK